MKNENSVCFVAKIKEIAPIPGADNIELAVIEGWNSIVKKGAHSIGELVIVATTDAIIPEKIAEDLGIANYLRSGNRVRTVKLRGVYSECLIITPKGVYDKKLNEGDDLMDVLKVFKYEPPVKQVQLSKGGRKIRYQDNPNFQIYYKFPNMKNVPDIFNEKDEVQITRKIHGTNARFGLVKKVKLSFWDKTKKFLGIADDLIEYDFVVGSHNVEKGSDSQGFYDTNVWHDIAKKYDIQKHLKEYVKEMGKEYVGQGIIVYGEIYGAGIQKNYDYGMKDIDLVCFDIVIDGEYVPMADVRYMLTKFHLQHVPILYEGFWSKEIQDSFVFNNFVANSKIPHEGVVIKALNGLREKTAKVINPDYLIYSEKHDVSDSH